MRILLSTAAYCATVAMTAEILLPDELMIVVLAAISVLVVFVAWWLLQREHQAAKAAGVEAAFEALIRRQYRAQRDE